MEYFFRDDMLFMSDLIRMMISFDDKLHSCACINLLRIDPARVFKIAKDDQNDGESINEITN